MSDIDFYQFLLKRAEEIYKERWGSDLGEHPKLIFENLWLEYQSSSRTVIEEVEE